MPLDCPTNDDRYPVQADPYDALLKVDLEPKWTDTQLNQHILAAVKYGVQCERERILSATRLLTYDVG